MFAAIIRRLKQSMEPEVPKVLAAVFEPTLQVCVLLCLSEHFGSCYVRHRQTHCVTQRQLRTASPPAPACPVLNTCLHSSCVYPGECMAGLSHLLPLHTCR